MKDVMSSILHIVIESGDVFEGTLDQFKDCFFSNADVDSIRKWCKDQDFSCEITFNP